jgi:hypothetical protein
MIKMHRLDCVSYLLVNDHVVVEWWVEYKVAYDIQWQEDMHKWQSVAWLVNSGLWMQLYKCSEKAVLMFAPRICHAQASAGKPSMICCSKW